VVPVQHNLTKLRGIKSKWLLSTEQENDPTAVYQIVNKKLQQYLGSSSLSSRSDARAALAESGSPNVKITNSTGFRKA
jgi:hypothetical protein